MSESPAATSPPPPPDEGPPLKVALVILHADPARGGAERYTVDLAAALAKRRHQVTLLASDFAGPIEGVNEVALPAKGATRSSGYRRFLRELDDHISTRRFDVVHAML